MTLGKTFLGLIFASLLAAQTTDHPISALPYAPSLDLTSMDRYRRSLHQLLHYACGDWIKKNPIPPDQARWDVYSKLTQDNELFLWGILAEAAKPAPDRSAEQRADRRLLRTPAWMKPPSRRRAPRPLQPALDQIAALNSVGDLPGFVARQHLESQATTCCSASAQIRITPTLQRHRVRQRGGLGLPDRDYYVKTDAKSVETRQKYLEHVRTDV